MRFLVYDGGMMKLFSRLVLSAVVLLAVTGCQQQRYTQKFPVYKGYKKAPYTLKGTRYYPLSVEEALSYREDGIASFYEADGAPGAIGQRLYPRQFYAAHKTLPLPCVCRVTNLTNGRSCYVRVADRGPFIHGRLIDVSTSVARYLGFERKGLERVRVEVISVGDGPWKRTR